MLIPSTITARRTGRYTSTLYIPGTIHRLDFEPMNDGGRYRIQPPKVSNLSAHVAQYISTAYTGVSLEDFTRRWGLPVERANELRFHVTPTAAEMRAILEWACSVRCGVEVMLRDSDEPMPYLR